MRKFKARRISPAVKNRMKTTIKLNADGKCAVSMGNGVVIKCKCIKIAYELSSQIHGYIVM